MKREIIFIVGILVLLNIVYAQDLWSDHISSEFEITDAVPICNRESFTWKKWEAEALQEWDALTNCYESDGIPQICCPEGYKCGYALSPSDDNYMRCYESAEVISYCEDYKEKIECGSAAPEVASRSIERAGDVEMGEGICEEGYIEINSTDPNCIRYSNCLCYWDDSDGCSAGVEYSKWYCDYPGVDPDPPKGDDGICILKKSTVEGSCQEDDFIRITYARQWVGTGAPPHECSGNFTRNIACPAKLVFFTVVSFILSSGIIILTYLMLKKKKRK